MYLVKKMVYMSVCAGAVHRSLLMLVFAVATLSALSTTQTWQAPHAQAASSPECPQGGTFNSATGKCTIAWSYSTSIRSWTVPAGVTSLDITVIGARGGTGGWDAAGTGGTSGSVGRLIGAVTVTGGQVVQVAVGGNGQNGRTSDNDNVAPGGVGGVNPLSGYNGGTGGGASCTFSQCGVNRGNSGSGGGGGAASVLRVGSTNFVAAGAGGGGGSGFFSRGTNGTTGSLTSGTNGQNGTGGGSARSDGGGSGAGGGGVQGGRELGYLGSGDEGGRGGSAGSNGSGTGITASFISPQNGSISIAYLAAPVVTSFAATSNLTNSNEPVQFALEFSIPVNGLDASDFTLGGTATGCTIIGVSGSGSSYVLEVSGCSDGTVIPQISSDSVAGIDSGQTGPPVPTNASTLTIDRTPNTVDLLESSDLGVSPTDNLTSDNTPAMGASNLIVGADVTWTATRTTSSGVETVVCGPIVASSLTDTCTFDELSDGDWSVEVQQTFVLDGVLTTSSPSVPLQITIDTVPPAAPGDISLASSSDSGVSNSDSITNHSTPTIDLTGLEVGTLVIVTASKPGSPDVTCEIANVATVNESCTFTTALADGEWTFSAVQMDDAGNLSEATSQITATIDTSAGVTLSSTPLSTGTSATNATSFTVTATLTDVPANGTEFTESDIMLGGTSSGWAIEPGTWRQISPTLYEFVVSSSTANDGTLTIDVSSGSYEDTAGNAATASNVLSSVIVVNPPSNTAAPVVSAISGTTTTLGSTLSTTDGTWNDKGDINPTTVYQWQICDDALGTNCVDVAGATGSTWIPTSAAEGKFVRSVVTRTNVAGEAEQSSNIVGPMIKSPQDINFTAPATQTYSPTPFTIAPTSVFPSSTDLTGLTVQMTSETPDVCTVDGFNVTMLKAGTCTLAADQPGDGQFDSATQVVRSFTIDKAPQTAATTASAQYSDPSDPVSLTTTQLGTGAVTYTVKSGPCTVDPNDPTKLIASGLGDCVVGTTVLGDDRYFAPSSVADVTVKFRDIDAVAGPAVSDRLTSDGPVSWVPSTTSGRAPTIVATGACTYDATSGEIVPSGVGGACTITADVADDGQWSEASITRTFNFAAPPAAPTISNVSVSGADGVAGGTALLAFTPGAMNGSVLLDYTVTVIPTGGGAPMTQRCASSPCTITGLTPGEGYTFEVVTNATAAGIPVFSPSSMISSQVVVQEPHPVILAGPSRVSPGATPFDVTTASLVDASWTPTVVSTSPSVCTVTGVTVSIIGQGMCTLVASHEGGTSAGLGYGHGAATISIRVAAPASFGPSPGTPQASTPVTVQDLTACQLSALNGVERENCPLSNPLPDADAGEAIVGAGGQGGAGPTRGIIQPMRPGRTVVERLPGGRTANVTVNIRQGPSNAPVRSVVIVVFDDNGLVIARIAVRVPRGETSVVATVPFLEDSYRVRTYTTNEAGVSRNAPIGANVLKQPTTLGKKRNGAPILFGKRIARAVLFDPDSPALDARAKERLDKVVRFTAKNGGRVLITGFVRNQGGSVKFQRALSDDRAEQVAMYLSKRGVRTWIRYSGYGAYRPGQGLPRDRRVEVRWSADAIPVLKTTAPIPALDSDATGA